MSRERVQAMASCQLASVGSETTTETTLRSKNTGLYYLIPARTFVVHFERKVGLGFQGGKRLRVGFSTCGEREDPVHTVFIAVNFATLGSVNTPTYGKHDKFSRGI